MSDLNERIELLPAEQDTTPDFDLVSLNHPKSKYTVQQKINVATLYVMVGRIKDIAIQTGVPAGTISGWKNNAKWWDETIAEVKLTKNEELEAIMTHALHTASEQILDRLENGNETMVNGEPVRIRVPARELAQLTNTLFEKRSLMRGDPTRIAVEKKVDFTDLAKQFKEFSSELAKEEARRVVN